MSFKFQLGHGLGEIRRAASLAALNRELELLGGQIGLVSPILFFFVVRAIKRSFEPTPDGDPARPRRGRARARWRSSCTARRTGAPRRTGRRSPGFRPSSCWPPSRSVPTVPNAGSTRGLVARRRAFGGRVHPRGVPHHPAAGRSRPGRQGVRLGAARRAWWTVTSRRCRSRPSAGDELYVAAERYQDASELAYHMKAHPRVYSLNLLGRANQYDLWVTFHERAGPGRRDDPRARRREAASRARSGSSPAASTSTRARASR